MSEVEQYHLPNGSMVRKECALTSEMVAVEIPKEVAEAAYKKYRSQVPIAEVRVETGQNPNPPTSRRS
ncbi:MAG: hypothetical protein IJV02_00200 [Candidatus Methanomethylophilaceae archaeon]|nr:hypothetical protein [Candidatus Methanomethylophilaceae archaeon]